MMISADETTITYLCQLTMQMMISADEKITITEIPMDPADDDFYR